jgi:hypothetical protein
MLGSVSHAVSLHAKCSVEIVRIKDIAKQDETQAVVVRASKKHEFLGRD